MTPFTDGKPRVATEEDCNLPWSSKAPGVAFRCGFCGHKFVPGDYWRWVFTNDIKNAPGNPFVCDTCDCEDIKDKWIEKWNTWRRLNDIEFWWFNNK